MTLSKKQKAPVNNPKALYKDAMKRIHSIDMFSKRAWKEINEKCGDISKDADSKDIADGFIDFQITWYEDNDVDRDYLTEKQCDELDEILVNRYADYLLDD